MQVVKPRYGFQLLAPATTQEYFRFGEVRGDMEQYSRLLRELQRLRGRLYLSDEAITSEDLDDDGRFTMPDDEHCWHLILVDSIENVIGCVRYLKHANRVTVEDLRAVRHCPLSNDPLMRPTVWKALEADLELAQRYNLGYIEIGGWALVPEWRNTKAALDILAGSYALGELWGGCLGVCTATARHNSASILRKMGAKAFEVEGKPLPSYYDPRYGCSMELLRFDRSPAHRFAPLIDPLKKRIVENPILSYRPSVRTLERGELRALA